MNDYTLKLKLSSDNFSFTTDKFPMTEFRKTTVCTRELVSSNYVITYKVEGEDFTSEDYKEVEQLFFELVKTLDFGAVTMDVFSDFISFLNSTLNSVYKIMMQSAEHTSSFISETDEFEFGEFLFSASPVVDEYESTQIEQFIFKPEILTEESQSYVVATDPKKTNIEFSAAISFRDVQYDQTSIKTSVAPFKFTVMQRLAVLDIGVTDEMGMYFKRQSSWQDGIGVGYADIVREEVDFVKQFDLALKYYLLSRQEVPEKYRKAIRAQLPPVLDATYTKKN